MDLDIDLTYFFPSQVLSYPLNEVNLCSTDELIQMLFYGLLQHDLHNICLYNRFCFVVLAL